MNGDILNDAHALINALRQDDYGTPAESFQRIADMWSAYLGHPISCRDVACLMALLKLAREANAHKRDSWSHFVRQVDGNNKVEAFVVHAAFLSSPRRGSGPFMQGMPLYTSSGV